ncbi:VOC family protein [Aquihabitans sp. G128]|uniref:VOC family protein n=1 Tax=Aquihabitans sp. G128 TaxID=2849779 RepID=UPI001C210017|nr:VOC family protein [Aquihabitans sp. G128]QXC59890.1 VOC family protein [Aquihabitans sp. G128]
MTTRDAAPAGAPTWIELFTGDAAKARAFYGGLFGWEAEEPNEEFGGYFTFTKDGVPVAGGMVNDGSTGQPDTWTVYFDTADAQATADTAVAAGATLIDGPVEMMDLGTGTYLTDPTGVNVATWQPGTHTGLGAVAEPGAPSWFELLSRDYDTAVAFYSKVFSLDVNVASDTPEFRYSTLKSGGDEVVGIMDGSAFLPEGAPARWAVYIQVEDAEATAAKAVELGGAVVQGPDDTPYGKLVVLTDPTGVEVKLQQP